MISFIEELNENPLGRDIKNCASCQEENSPGNSACWSCGGNAFNDSSAIRAMRASSPAPLVNAVVGLVGVNISLVFFYFFDLIGSPGTFTGSALLLMFILINMSLLSVIGDLLIRIRYGRRTAFLRLTALFSWIAAILIVFIIDLTH